MNRFNAQYSFIGWKVLVNTLYLHYYNMEKFYHVPFSGNPYKKGVVDITDAPYLPISQREKLEKRERRLEGSTSPLR